MYGIKVSIKINYVLCQLVLEYDVEDMLLFLCERRGMYTWSQFVSYICDCNVHALELDLGYSVYVCFFF